MTRPGVRIGQIEHVTGMGSEVIAVVNCKCDPNVHLNATAVRTPRGHSTKLLATTVFGDGTKSHTEKAAFANRTSLVWLQRPEHALVAAAQATL